MRSKPYNYADTARVRLWHAGRSAVIINLQKTCKDAQAALVIHAKCDGVMAMLAKQLSLAIPSYCRDDRCVSSRGKIMSLPVNLVPGQTEVAGKAAAHHGHCSHACVQVLKCVVCLLK